MFDITDRPAVVQLDVAYNNNLNVIQQGNADALQNVTSYPIITIPSNTGLIGIQTVHRWS